MKDFLFFVRSSSKSISLLVLALVVGAFDFIGFGLFYPLVHVLTNKAPSPNDPLNQLNDWFGLNMASSLNNLLVLIAVILSVKALLTLLYHGCAINVTIRYINDLRTEIFSSFLQSKYSTTSSKSSRIVNATSQQGALACGALYLGFQVVQNTFVLIACMILAVLLSWQIFSLTVLLALLLLTCFKPTFSASQRLGQNLAKLSEELSSVVLKVVENMRYVKSTDCGGGFYEIIKRTLNNIRKVQVRFTVLNRSTSVIGEPLGILVFSFVILVGLYFGYDPDMLALQAFMMHRTFSKLNPLVALIQNYKSQSASLEYCQNLLDDAKDLKPERVSGRIFESLKKEIVLEGVSVSFGDKKVLNGIDITFPSKKITVVMGESGVGKTTIFNILTGLIEPTRGRAAIDGNDLRDYAINSYRKKIGLVSQDGIVFPGNLRENLLLRNENATDEKMVEFIELFGLNSLFPDGVPDLDFRIEENNTNLSGGQRQRIAMIRELLVSPEILLMDEPTSALDEKTQSIVIDFINKKKGKMTVIIITHQKELLKLADVVYEIEEKRINLLK